MDKKILLFVNLLAIYLQYVESSTAGELRSNWLSFTDRTSFLSLLFNCTTVETVPELKFPKSTATEQKDHIRQRTTYLCKNPKIWEKEFYMLEKAFIPKRENILGVLRKMRYYEKESKTEIFCGPEYKYET